MSASNMKLGLRFARVYVALILLAMFSSMLLVTNVDAGEVGVRYNNATGLLRQDLKPGLHLEVTGVHRIWRLPSRYLFINYTEDENDALVIRTKDNNTVTVDVSIPYRIVDGSAWKVMDAGNHLRGTDGRYRFQRFAEETSTSVLREHLASLRSEDFYATDRRLTVAKETLAVLNKKLEPYHLEADTVVIRAAYFRKEYETQLAQIQFNEQQKLLDGAKQRVSDRQQSLDNYNQRTEALVAAKAQDWARRSAQLDRAYQVGFLTGSDDLLPGAARRQLQALGDADRATLLAQAAEVLGLPEERIRDEHLLGIKNIQAETTEYDKRVRAQSEGVAARLAAEGNAKVALVKGGYEGRLNTLLNSNAGRAYVAYHAAANVKFADDLTFQSRDGIPSVLRLGEFARKFMGK